MQDAREYSLKRLLVKDLVLVINFEHLAYIIERVHTRIPIGVCIDTCHIFAAGYDLQSFVACDRTLNEFDSVVGLKHLYAFHVNDSVKP